MNIRLTIARAMPLLAIPFLLIACTQEPSAVVIEQPSDVVLTPDEQLRQRVEEALVANAADLGQGFQVEVINGNVSLTGSLDCGDCGGLRTPGTFDTIQQSIGAIVRAIPGVAGVNFTLTTEP